MQVEETLPVWSIIPFVGMLLSIAIFPLVKEKWWEGHQLHVAAFWSVVFLVPFCLGYGIEETAVDLMEVIILDYVPFIALLFGLFVVAGGINLRGTVVGTTKNNVVLLLIGTALSSIIGTTGAAMLMIRPVIRANAWRKNKVHLVVFFIFLVANIGGCLTPLGDPPLFLGYLRGIPFFWTLEHLWPLFLVNVAVLTGVFALVDHRFLKKEVREGRSPAHITGHDGVIVPIRIEGAHNFAFIALIIAGVILNGSLPQMEGLIDPGTGQIFGISLHEGVHLGLNYFVQLAFIVVATVLSLKTTKRQIREHNGFEWGPIAEVARLFIGIFITMIPALILLRAHGGSLGIDTPLEFFWATGSLSSFLDNSPTYVVFLTTAGSLGIAADVFTSVGFVGTLDLIAISAGAVFMGAMTYIGNAPNFMVKSIAEKSGIKMPSFFGYMAWSLAILVPLFIVDSLIFFR
ncbi:MAG: sodium:proton antiporter [Coriobacteriaceae bacterium]|jgi:Na+/H+ antiporter NhaD/arsenite permease-like protein|nr:sodium:proton antiporter [Coriobacteriaceae bacterium]